MTSRFRVNWHQAAGEGLLIFLGVVAALLGQAWWESRSEHEIVVEHLANVRDELEANLEDFRVAARDHRSDAQRAALLSRLLREEVPATRVDSVRALTIRLHAYTYVLPRTAALNNLLQSGELRLIEDQSLRIELSRYDQALATYADYGQDLTRFQTTQMQPALRRATNLVGLGFKAMLESEGYELEESRYEFDPEALRTLEFENLIFGRIAYDHEAAQYLDDVIQATEALLSRLGE